MAFTKRDVKDRLVQYPRRYQLVEVQSGIFDLIPVTGTITEPGTPINKAYLQPIEDAIADIESGATKVSKATNADKVGGHSETHFVRTRDYGTIDLNNPAYPYPYITDIDNGTPIGLDSNWYHIIYMAHRNANGYGSQIAVCFFSSTKKMYFRSSDNTTWGPWTALTPENHASTGTSYGVGNASNYGHVKVRNDLVGTETSGATVSPAQIKALNESILAKWNQPTLLTSFQITTGVEITPYFISGYDMYLVEVIGSLSAQNTNTYYTYDYRIGISAEEISDISPNYLFIAWSIQKTSSYSKNDIKTSSLLLRGYSRTTADAVTILSASDKGNYAEKVYLSVSNDGGPYLQITSNLTAKIYGIKIS